MLLYYLRYSYILICTVCILLSTYNVSNFLKLFAPAIPQLANPYLITDHKHSIVHVSACKHFMMAFESFQSLINALITFILHVRNGLCAAFDAFILFVILQEIKK